MEDQGESALPGHLFHQQQQQLHQHFCLEKKKMILQNF
jgi:hypothetical protein